MKNERETSEDPELDALRAVGEDGRRRATRVVSEGDMVAVARPPPRKSRKRPRMSKTMRPLARLIRGVSAVTVQLQREKLQGVKGRMF